jgi:sugar lactone lactonase YvrE
MAKLHFVKKSLLLVAFSLVILGLSAILLGRRFTVAAYDSLGNDNYSSAYEITQLDYSYNGSNTGYTMEDGEFDDAGSIANTAWFKWLATATDTFTISTCTTSGGSAISDTILSLFDNGGSSGEHFHQISDDAYDCGLYSRFSFSANEGTTYYFQLGAYSGAVQKTGDYTIVLSESVAPTPTPVPTPTSTPAPTPTAFPSYTSSVNIPSSYVDIGIPHGMAITSDGMIWYADSANNRLIKMDPATNEILRVIGRTGSGEGEFNSLYGLTIDSNGYLYALSTDARVYKLDSNGGYMASYDIGAYVTNTHGITYDAYSNRILVVGTNSNNIAIFDTNMNYKKSFGSAGYGAGEFEGPWGLTTDSNGRLYVSDEFYSSDSEHPAPFNGRVQVFSADNRSNNYTHAFDITHWYDDHDNELGFFSVKDIVVLSNGTIVVDVQNKQVVVEYNSSGVWQSTFGYGGSGESNMNTPEFLVRDADNNIYVTDWARNTITKYNSSGVFQSSFRNNNSAEGQLYYPNDVIYDASGNMYVKDSADRIQEFTNGGTWMATVVSGGLGTGQYHITFTPDGNKLLATNSGGVRVYTKDGSSWDYTGNIGEGGSGAGQFVEARGMAFDSSGNLFIADLGNHRIQKWTVSDGVYTYSMSFGAGWKGVENTNPISEIGQLGWPHDVAIDSSNNVYVGDEFYVMKYDSSGTFMGIIGNRDQYVHPQWVLVEGDTLYVSDDRAARVEVYSISEPLGTFLDNIGSYGTGMMQFLAPNGMAINPATDRLTVADPSNGRVVSISAGYRVRNLIASAKVIDRTTGDDLSDYAWPTDHFTDAAQIPASLIFGDYVVADFNLNLTEDRDWSEVNVLTLPTDSKALVVNLNQDTAPGISNTHSLYVYRYNNQESVTVCPDATVLSQVNASCNNGYDLSLENPSVNGTTLTSIDGYSVDDLPVHNYWKIDGLTGTGAFSSLFTTSFQLNDLMTREKVDTASDHIFTFGTTYDLTHAGDTITLTFDPAWDFSLVIIGDLTLKGGDTTMTLAGTETVNDWLAQIDSNTITLTAPPDGSDSGYITHGTVITLAINNEHLVNPPTVGSYKTDMVILSDSEQYIETGSVTVPIVDSDQVDITGYVNNYIVFNIDTGTTDTTCSFNGCPLYGGSSSNGTNYTVDLGELSSIYVNQSLVGDTIMHSDGHTGAINSIYLGLTSNANNGTVVTVSSANEGLVSSNSTIPAVTDGNNITINSGLYGYTTPNDFWYTNNDHGEVILSSNCDSASQYCGPATTPKEVFNTNGAPVDGARVRMDLAAAAAYTDSPGTYTDTLTFVATGSF